MYNTRDSVARSVLAAGICLLSVMAVACTQTATAPKVEDSKGQAPKSEKATEKSAAGKALAKVRVAAVGAGNTGDAPFAIGVARGYYSQEGMELEFTRVNRGPLAIPMIERGELEAIGFGIAAGTFEGMLQGVPIRIVADKGSYRSGGGGLALIVRKQLWDNGTIRTMADLKGKRIGQNGLAGTTTYMVEMAMKNEGMTGKEAINQVIPFGDMPAALDAGSIDAAVINEPIATFSVEKGMGKIFKTASDMIPGGQGQMTVMNVDWAKKNERLGVGLMKAYIRSIRDYNDWIDRGAPNDEIAQILGKWTDQDPQLVTKVMPTGLHPEARLNKEDMQKLVDWMHENGDLKQKVDVKQWIDESWIDKALAELKAEGKVK